MKKILQSKMLDEVRRWREKAYHADKAEPPAKRTEEAEELARRLDLPLAKTSGTEGNQRA